MTTVLSLSPAFSLHVQAQDVTPQVSSPDQLLAIEKVSNEVLKTEIQLMKISSNFHAEWLKPNRWKSWRLFLYKLADSGSTNAGITTIAASRFEYMDDPSKAPRPYLKAGHIINLTGASILIGGTLIEIFLDRVAEHRIARKKQDPKSVLSEFLQLRESLDDLLAKRNTLADDMSGLSPCQREIIQADGLVLQDLRELVSTDFYHAYRNVAQLRAVRDTSNATALLSCAAAGYLGSLQSLLSVANRYPPQTGVAGLGFVTAGTTVATTPIVVKAGGALAKKKAENKLLSNGFDLSDSTQDKFDQHRAKFEKLISAAPDSELSLLKALDARNTIYKLHNEMLDSRDLDRAAAKKKSRRDMLERMIFSSIVGGTNIARGSQLMVAGFHYANVPKTNFKLVASASTAFIAGSSVWTIDNVQGKVREEMLERRIKRGKLSVHGKLIQDLENLEEMEDQISVY